MKILVRCSTSATLVVITSSFSPPLPLDYAKSLQDNVSFNEFRSGLIPLICIPNIFTPEMVSQLKFDAAALQIAGFGGTAGVVSKQQAKNLRKDVHQIWLTSPGSRPPMPLLGNLDQRKQLLRFMDNLRLQLEGPRALPEEFVELSYLLYKPGSYYKRHIDTIDDKDNRRDFTRNVSVILYLGEHGDDREWNCEHDGGALRIHGKYFSTLTGNLVQLDEKGDAFSDITPYPGSLILFDSSKVPHEAVKTSRGRVCVVGWFGSLQHK